MAEAMNVKNCMCDVCGAEAHSFPGKKHRRCSGNPEHNEPVGRGKNIPPAQRGTWQQV